MIQRFDHLVLGVEDLDRAEVDFRNSGFDVLDRKGALGPMRNRLVRYADNSFIELLAFDGESEHRFRQRWSKGSGWIDYAMNSSNFEGRPELLEQVAGVCLPRRTISKLSPFTREHWHLELIEPSVGGLDPVLPFLIEERTPLEWRIPKLPDTIIQPHGITGVAGVTLVTDDIQRSKSLLATLFGKPKPIDSRHGAGTIAILFEDGLNWVELVQPIKSATALGTHIQKFGTGLYAATLRGSESIKNLPVAAKYSAVLSVAATDKYPFS